MSTECPAGNSVPIARKVSTNKGRGRVAVVATTVATTAATTATTATTTANTTAATTAATTTATAAATTDTSAAEPSKELAH